MAKHLLLSRDEQGDWYKRAQTFLADNGVKPLRMEINDKPRSSNTFLKAASLLANNTGEPVTVDDLASIVVITADQQMMAGDEEFSSICKCECGMSSSCGGGGGGS